jgi:hypothetical protein
MRQKLMLHIIIVKPNLILKDPKRIGSVALQRIAIPIITGKFEIGMRSRSDPQNNMIFRIAPIHNPIRQKPAHLWHMGLGFIVLELAGGQKLSLSLGHIVSLASKVVKMDLFTLFFSIISFFPIQKMYPPPFYREIPLPTLCQLCQGLFCCTSSGHAHIKKKNPCTEKNPVSSIPTAKFVLRIAMRHRIRR